MMGRSRLLAMLLLSSLLLLLSFSHGFGRKVMQTVKQGGSPVELEESGGGWRKMAELMDYSDPEPNTNPRSGFLWSPPVSPGQEVICENWLSCGSASASR